MNINLNKIRLSLDIHNRFQLMHNRTGKSIIILQCKRCCPGATEHASQKHIPFGRPVWKYTRIPKRSEYASVFPFRNEKTKTIEGLFYLTLHIAKAYDTNRRIRYFSGKYRQSLVKV